MSLPAAPEGATEGARATAQAVQIRAGTAVTVGLLAVSERSVKGARAAVKAVQIRIGAVATGFNFNLYLGMILPFSPCCPITFKRP